MFDDLLDLDSGRSPRREPLMAETPSEEPAAVPSQEASRECVQKFREHCLAQKDPVRAALGAVNAGLMALELPMADVLQRSLCHPSLTIGGVQKLLPALETCHHLARMIERFGQLDLRIAAERRNRKRSRPAVEKPR